MKKMKKLGVLFLAGALSMGVGALAACGDDDNATNADNGNGANATAYTLIVKDEDGNPMSDYYIGICIMKDGKITNCLDPVKTDANGKVVFEVAEGTYHVNDGNPYDNYVLKEEYTLTDYGTTEVIIVDTSK